MKKIIIILLSLVVVLPSKANHFDATLADAIQGDEEAQYALGQMYYFGNGVDKNYTEAKKWYKKAAEQGYSDAIERYNELKSMGYKERQNGLEKVLIWLENH